jgi:hypothetical protein
MKLDTPIPEWGDTRTLHAIFGLRESLVYKWLRLGLIKSVIVKTAPNARRGKRLIQLDSVRKLLAANAGNPPGVAGPGCRGRKQQQQAAA